MQFICFIYSEEPSITQQHPLSSAAYWSLTQKKVHLVWTPFLYFAAAGCSRLSLKFLYLVSSYNLCLLWTNSKFSACWREIFFICNQHKPFCWSLAHWPNTGSLCGLFTHFILMVISGGLKIGFQYSLHNSKSYNIKRLKMNKALFGLDNSHDFKKSQFTNCPHWLMIIFNGPGWLSLLNFLVFMMTGTINVIQLSCCFCFEVKKAQS